MKRGTLLAVLALVGLVVFGCLGTVVAVALIGNPFLAMTEPDFGPLVVPPRDVKPLFGVTLPSALLHYDGRQGGFQDPTYELLVELAPNTLEAFLTDNHLTRSEEPPGFLPDDVKSRIPKFETFKATNLELPEIPASAGSPDGRSAILLEGDGGDVWIYFFAFET